MNLGPNSVKKLVDLFSSRNQYWIPLYQRRYVWDKSNWEALWRDIIQLQHRIDDGEMDKKHFAGTIITYAEEEDNPQANWEIIDGQQRLTTFQVIFCVIRDLCTSGKYPLSITSDILPDVEEFTKLSKIQKTDESSQFRLFLTAHDKSAFQTVVSGELGKGVKKASPNVLEKFQSLAEAELTAQNPIITAYGYFGAEITSYLAEKGSSKLIGLMQTLSNNVRVIKVDLDDTDEPEKIFETINDTGRMLDDFDYLRNHLFLRFRKLEQPALDVIYKENWEKFEKWDIGKQEMFFRMFLIAKLGPACFESGGKVVKPFNLYRKYSNMLTEIPSQNTEYSQAVTKSLGQNQVPLSQVEYELEELSRYAASFEELTDSVPVTKDSDLVKFGNRMRFYDGLNLPRLDSFILFLKHRLGLSTPLLHDVCNILESYIIRRMLCVKHYEEIYRQLNSFFAKALETVKFNIKDFVSFLCDSLDSEVQVKNALNRAWSKDATLIIYIFYRIELLKREQNPNFYTPLCFEDLQVRERISYPIDANESYMEENLGNIIPLKFDLDDWDYCTFTAKKQLLVNEVAMDLILSKELYGENDWDTDPTAKIKRRNNDLLSCFDRIWKPDLVDYI